MEYDLNGRQRGGLLDTGVNFVFALVFIGILAGAGLVSVVALSTNYQAIIGSNASLWTTGQTAAVGGIGNSSLSLLNLTTQLPTVGTIAGIGLLIMVLFTAIGAFVYLGNKE